MISVAFKTPLKTRLGNCFYKTSLLHRPDEYIRFTPSCPPTLCNKMDCVEQCSQTTFDQRAILQKRDNSRATSHKMVCKNRLTR